MKVKNLILHLQKLDQEADIFYCGEDEEEEYVYFPVAVMENQEKNEGKITKYYSIEKLNS
jgi:hypothetical protein